MELEINGEKLEYMDAVFSGILEEEASVEKIVPDAMADVSEVICARVLPILRSKEASDGRITVTGTAEISVLCRFENGGVSALNSEAPLTFSCDVPGADSDSALIVSIVRAEASAETVNPRKLSVAVKAACSAVCLAPGSVTLPVSCGDGVEVKRETAELVVTESAFEKTFSLSEELSVPAGKPEIGEVLTACGHISCEDRKAVGSKLVVRGTVTAEVTYIPSGGGEAERAVLALPYSQIIDLSERAEEAEFEVTPALTGLYLARGGGERAVLADVNAVLQCRVLRRRTVDYLSDAYCTACDLESEYKTEYLTGGRDISEVSGTLRGTVPVEGGVEKVVSVTAIPPAAAVFSDGSVTAGVKVSVLYIANGELKCASQILPAEAPCEYADTPEPVSVLVPDEIYAVPGAGGIDVRCRTVFRIVTEKTREISFVSSASLGEGKDDEKAPSLLLKRARRGETMWQLSKVGKSTPEMIIAANGLEEGAEIEPGRLLIIPRRR